MLRRDKAGKQATFADQARAAQAVPSEHVLTRMKRAVDWAAIARRSWVSLPRRGGV